MAVHRLGEALGALLDMSEAPRAMGRAWTQGVEQKFDVEKTAGRLLALLTTIAHEHR